MFNLLNKVLDNNRVLRIAVFALLGFLSVHLWLTATTKPQTITHTEQVPVLVTTERLVTNEEFVQLYGSLVVELITQQCNTIDSALNSLGDETPTDKAAKVYSLIRQTLDKTKEMAHPDVLLLRVSSTKLEE